MDGIGGDADVVEVPPLAVVAEALTRPGQAEDVDALLGARDPLGHGEPEGPELVGGVAEPDPQLDATARELIEHGEVLGQADRVGERDDRDVRGDPHPRRHRRRGAGHGDERREVAVLDEVVLAEPDEVEPEPVEHADLLDRLGVDVLQREVATGWAAEVVGDTEAQWEPHAVTVVGGPWPHRPEREPRNPLLTLPAPCQRERDSEESRGDQTRGAVRLPCPDGDH